MPVLDSVQSEAVQDYNLLCWSWEAKANRARVQEMRERVRNDLLHAATGNSGHGYEAQDADLSSSDARAQNLVSIGTDSAFHARINPGNLECPLGSTIGLELKHQEVNEGVNPGEGRCFPINIAKADHQTLYDNGGSRGVHKDTISRSSVVTDGPFCVEGEESVNRVSQTAFPRGFNHYDETIPESRSQKAELVNSLDKSNISDSVQVQTISDETKSEVPEDDQLVCSLKDVLIVDNLETARAVINLLRGDYWHLVHACDTEVADIDVKKECPVGHGRVICFSIYCGPEADFGNGKTCVWVDVLDSDGAIIDAFKEYFEDSSIKKVWHNFSFDRHVLQNHGIKAAGFYADTMHLARLWNSGRKNDSGGGYSLESLTSDMTVMNGVHTWNPQRVIKKTSMKDLFGANNIKKDGTKGKIKVIPPVKEIQTSESLRERWICYSAGDAICTWSLWESLHEKLINRNWLSGNLECGNMYDFYDQYWRPFGELLAQMEAEGMLIDREYLADIGKVASKERALSISRFRKWAAKYCPDAQYINVTSDSQIRQLLYGGHKKVSKCRSFNVPNVNGYIEEGKKAPKKNISIEIRGIDVELPSDICTSGGLPAVSMPALKALAGKVPIDCSEVEDDLEELISQESDESMVLTSAGVMASAKIADMEEEDLSVYGAAYHAFKGGQEGKEACKAIAALCEVSAIDTLITTFIQPLQAGDILGPDSRVHCSLNLNTETGRLSARRPNLQNQPALEKDRYKIRQAFIASPGNSLIVADYGQLELRLLAHLANCRSMLEAFKVGGDFHSRTAMNMYDHVRKAVERGEAILEWDPKPGEVSPPAPLLKDVYAAERRKAKMLNFSIAYGKTARGLAKDWKVTLEEAQQTVNLWYRDRHEVRQWQQKQKMNAREKHCVHTLLGRARHFPSWKEANNFSKGHIERAAINTPVQGSAADVAMLAMLEIAGNAELKALGWKLLLQVHDEMILEGPTESAGIAKDLVIKAMSYPFKGKNILQVALAVDAKYANSWYAAK